MNIDLDFLFTFCSLNLNEHSNWTWIVVKMKSQELKLKLNSKMKNKWHACPGTNQWSGEGGREGGREGRREGGREGGGRTRTRTRTDRISSAWRGGRPTLAINLRMERRRHELRSTCGFWTPCVFVHREKNMHAYVYGDNFVMP